MNTDCNPTENQSPQPTAEPMTREEAKAFLTPLLSELKAVVREAIQQEREARKASG